MAQQLRAREPCGHRARRERQPVRWLSREATGMPEGRVRTEGETITALRASVRSVEVDEDIMIVGEMPEKMDSVAETERPRDRGWAGRRFPVSVNRFANFAVSASSLANDDSIWPYYQHDTLL